MLRVGGRGPAFKLLDFSRQALNTVQSTAPCSATFRPGLPLPLLHYSNTISTVTVLQFATQLKFVCLRFLAQLDVLLPIERLLLLTSRWFPV